MSNQNMDKKANWQRKFTVFKEYYLPYVFVAIFFLALIVGVTVFDSISPDEAFLVVSVLKIVFRQSLSTILMLFYMLLSNSIVRYMTAIKH